MSRNWAIFSHPWNLTFFGYEIFQFFSCLYGSKVPKWKCAHILLWKKSKNQQKTPKNILFTSPDPRSRYNNDTVQYTFTGHDSFVVSLSIILSKIKKSKLKGHLNISKNLKNLILYKKTLTSSQRKQSTTNPNFSKLIIRKEVYIEK